MWLAGLAIFSAVFIDGVVNNNFLQSKYDFQVDQSYIDSSYIAKNIDGDLIVFEDPELTKPIKVIEIGKSFTLTGVKISSSNQEKTKVQIINPLENKEQLGWIEINNNSLDKNKQVSI